MTLEAIKYDEKSPRLEILNQLKLPFQEEYDSINSVEDAWHAIKDMRVRGAPAIAIVAALSLAVELRSMMKNKQLPESTSELQDLISKKLDYLVTSRPTAVNLMDAVIKLKSKAEAVASKKGSTSEFLADATSLIAEVMLASDISDNENIGKFGSEWILENTVAGRKNEKVTVLTHCNTGSLATAGYGTALGVVRSLHAGSRLLRAYCTETRPYNQGSRLTAFELVHDQIPSTLITDSMAASLFALKGSAENIVAVIVGADRVAANGDTANKIGTYSLSILAKHHNIKFLVAAPLTTIDLRTRSGQDIVIEERPEQEVAVVRGPTVVAGKLNKNDTATVRMAADGINIWNPAFDITPAALIDGIITNVGVVEKDQDGTFHLEEYISKL
ncbi:MAG: S-methyl-5-thioribose-1-phosphate isomerase [Cirrosporium novae-zelandiae]|nr:MAG: S-methyl-5-thioribose-1-phosphate isomerase [Cirrosporium novae-zelandiae]